MDPGEKRPPETNLSGLRAHWRADLIAGFSVALVALPLALGIATAAGAPPISGLVSAIVAGLLTTFVRGSKVAINGPGNALIVIVASAFVAFGGGADAFAHVLGAAVVAGGLQVLLGVLRLGKLGDMVPAAVIQGMLAAIGLVIVGKQAHVAFGHAAPPGSPIDVFLALPDSVGDLHPVATIIGVISVAVLVVHPRIKAKGIHFVPAPLWVVFVTVPLAFFFEHYEAEVVAALGAAYRMDPGLLVSIPDDLLASLVHPDFSRIGEPAFWMVVVTFTLVSSIENIVSVKAVDKLDAYRRRSNLDRDLIAVGASTIVAGMLGGLPVLTVIARSSVNVNHGAKTGWSNFFHGLILLVFVVLLSPVIQEIALSALAGILVYTGFKLAAPHVVEDTLRKGPDHFLVFAITLGATLEWGLLWGIGVGIAAELGSHLLILGLRPREALSTLRETRIEVRHDGRGPHVLRVGGVANFLHVPRMRRALEAVPEGAKIIVDFSASMLVDTTLLEYCHDWGRRYEQSNPGRTFEILGLEGHRAIADHPDALHAQERRNYARRLTPRQRAIAEMAEARGWSFDPRRDWDPDHLDDFDFFRVHPVEYRDTVVHGSYTLDDGTEAAFVLSDVTFDEGALIPEVYHTTTQLISLPVELPELLLEKEDLLDRALELAGVKDIDFDESAAFSRRFVLRGPDEEAIRRLMTPEVIQHFVDEPQAYHVESTGRQIVVFETFMRRSTPREIEHMLAFGERLVTLLSRTARDSLPGTVAAPDVDPDETRGGDGDLTLAAGPGDR